MHRDQLYWTKRGDWCISGEFAIWNCQRPLQGRGGGAARGWSHQRAVKGPRFHVNVRAYYYEFRNNGTRACKLRLALFFLSLSLCVCLSSAHGGAEELNKPRLPRNDQPEEETGEGLEPGLFCRAAIFFTWTPIRRKVKKRLLFARSLRRLISSLLKGWEDLWRFASVSKVRLIESFTRERDNQIVLVLFISRRLKK